MKTLTFGGKQFDLTDDVLSRFWKYVDKRGDDECWPWLASRIRSGYGQLGVGGTVLRSHRLSYAIHYSDPGTLFVIHSCDNPPCCNPKHLSAGTSADNTRDMVMKGRATKGPGLRGSQVGTSKWTEDQVLAIRRAYKSLPRFSCGRIKDGHLTNLATSLGISVARLQRVAREGWRHVICE